MKGHTMTRKHYQQIAEMIRQTYTLNDGHEAGTIAHIAEQFATIAKRDNPNFDRDRFLTACGMNEGEWAI
jgi:hypothetical protein